MLEFAVEPHPTLDRAYKGAEMHLFVDRKSAPLPRGYETHILDDAPGAQKAALRTLGGVLHHDAALCVDLYAKEETDDKALCRARVGVATVFLRELPADKGATYKLSLEDPTTRTHMGYVTLSCLSCPRVAQKPAPQSLDVDHANAVFGAYVSKMRSKVRQLGDTMYLKRVMISKYVNRTTAAPGATYFLTAPHVVLDAALLQQWTDIVKKRYEFETLSGVSLETRAKVLADVSTLYTQSHRYVMDYVYRYGTRTPRESFDDIFVRGDGGDCEDMAKASYHTIKRLREGTWSGFEDLEALQDAAKHYVVAACLCQVGRPGVSMRGEAGHQAHMTTLLIPRAHFYELCGMRCPEGPATSHLNMLVCEGTGRMNCDLMARTPPAFCKFPIIETVSDVLCHHEEPFYQRMAHLFTDELGVADKPVGFTVLDKNGKYGPTFDAFCDSEQRKHMSFFQHEPLGEEIMGLVERFAPYEHPNVDVRHVPGLAPVALSGAPVISGDALNFGDTTDTTFDLYVHQADFTERLVRGLRGQLDKMGFKGARLFSDLNDVFRVRVYA